MRGHEFLKRGGTLRMVKIKIQAILFHDSNFINILMSKKLYYKSVLVTVLL